MVSLPYSFPNRVKQIMKQLFLPLIFLLTGTPFVLSKLLTALSAPMNTATIPMEKTEKSVQTIRIII